MPGISTRLGLGTSTSVSMVRVDDLHLVGEARHAARKAAVERRHPDLHLLADTHVGTADSGTGRISRSRLFCESRTSGIACVCEAVPA